MEHRVLEHRILEYESSEHSTVKPWTWEYSVFVCLT